MPLIGSSILPGPDTDGEDYGGVLYLPDAVVEHPNANVVLYVRVSSWGQKSNGSLESQTEHEQWILRSFLGDDKLKQVVPAVEYGQLSKKRKGLRMAIEAARKHQAILCTRDLSRFIRSEAYHGQKNNNVQPSSQEMARLLELAGGVVLATREEPSLTESQRHSAATKASPKCGRPSIIDYDVAMQILRELGGRGFKGRWGTSIAAVANRWGVSKPRVQRLLDTPVPEHLCGEDGLRLKDMRNPAQVYRKIIYGC